MDIQCGKCVGTLSELLLISTNGCHPPSAKPDSRCPQCSFEPLHVIALTRLLSTFRHYKLETRCLLNTPGPSHEPRKHLKRKIPNHLYKSFESFDNKKVWLTLPNCRIFLQSGLTQESNSWANSKKQVLQLLAKIRFFHEMKTLMKAKFLSEASVVVLFLIFLFKTGSFYI